MFFPCPKYLLARQAHLLGGATDAITSGGKLRGSGGGGSSLPSHPALNRAQCGKGTSSRALHIHPCFTWATANRDPHPHPSPAIVMPGKLLSHLLSLPMLGQLS